MMTEVQKKLFELLLEVKEICQENEIKYYLCENLLLDAYQNNKITGTYYDFSIMIHSEDVKKFIKAVKQKENRSIESLLTNKHFPGTYMRYVATDTLYFPLYRHKAYKQNGFAINIKILKNVPKNKLKSKILTVLEAGIELLNNKKPKLTLKRIFCLSIVFTLGIIGPKNRGKLIFNLLNNVKSKKSIKKYVYYKPTLGSRVKYKRKLFEQDKDILLNGVKFNIPSSFKYIKLNLGNENKKIPMPSYGITYIIDENIPYKEFFKESKRKKFPKNFYKKRKKLLKKDEQLKPYRLYVNNCWDLLYRTRDRFELYEEYIPLKETIIELYNNQNYEELNKILQNYLIKLEYYANKNLGLVFDPIIFQITIELLIYNKKNSLAKKCIQIVPKEHMIPLTEDLGLKWKIN